MNRIALTAALAVALVIPATAGATSTRMVTLFGKQTVAFQRFENCTTQTSCLTSFAALTKSETAVITELHARINSGQATAPRCTQPLKVYLAAAHARVNAAITFVGTMGLAKAPDVVAEKRLLRATAGIVIGC